MKSFGNKLVYKLRKNPEPELQDVFEILMRYTISPKLSKTSNHRRNKIIDSLLLYGKDWGKIAQKC